MAHNRPLVSEIAVPAGGGSRRREWRRGAWTAGACLAAAGLLAGGCGGSAGDIPEPRIFRIAYTPPAAATGAPLPVTLGVSLLRGDETYRQERMVYRTLPHRVAFYPYDRWEVSPVEMVTDVLIGHLRAAGAFRRVVPFAHDEKADYVLRGRLLRFDEEDGGPGTPWSAVVELDYQVMDAQKSEVVSTGSARAAQPVQGREPEAIVQALSGATREVLGSLSTQLQGALAAARR